MFEASRRAHAMGLLERDVARTDATPLRHLADRVRLAGIASSAADTLRNVESPSPSEVAGLLRTMIAALEASPVPRHEWGGMVRLFGDDLAPILKVSLSSLKRYQAAERETPDAVAARLHWLALTVGDLAGSYNDIGIRRWFHRKRERLGGRAPLALLRGDWDPDDEGPAQVRLLARELVSLGAT
jgi:hypothetical protein